MVMPFTCEQYQQMHPSEQIDQLEFLGTCLNLYRDEDAHEVVLFALSNFYVEVWIKKSSNKVVRTMALLREEDLEPYLATIDITDVYKELRKTA